MFFDNAVVLIDIMPHGRGHSDVWVNEKLIKKLHKYLPESIERYKAKGITGHELDSKQRLALQKSHCNYSLKMEDGTVYQLMGIMSNGDCFHDIHRLMHVQRNIDYFTQVIQADEKAFKQSLDIKENDNLTLTIAFHENEIKLYAPEQKTIININTPK
ncbi:hypothetical protein [Enterobacter kobei]|uniref:hypothetical protein n=1 Tax=Enterobacter kobei TaxID=208224 RepID=UPI0006674C71|nr:hypothetical protein [Enterobacter kobei]